MLQFVGYDFFGGPDALNSAPGKVDNITSTKLTNAIFDHFNLTKDLNLYGDIKVPEGWTYDTILNATFNGTTNAGNLDYMLGQISGIKIKRRVRGEFDWITLKYIPILESEDLTFTFNDFLNVYDTEYEYAIVPDIEGVEGRYIINSIISKFSGVFIGDAEQTFRFLYDVQYGPVVKNQQIGNFMPLGKAYPVIVANGVLSYDTGSVSATVTNDEYEKTGKLEKVKSSEKAKKIKEYLSNKKPKILKDWSGNIWLVMITGSPQLTYRQGSGLKVPQIAFDWTEIGDANNSQDLYDSGMIKPSKEGEDML